MKNLIKAIDFIPSNENIFFHCKLRDLKSKNNYEKTSILLIKLLKKKNLKSLIVPTYTYSFTKSLVFNRNFSPSEVGRFSEEVRLFCKSSQRSLDPIFSFVDVLNSGFVNNKISNTSFSKSSIFHKWHLINGIIVNFGLDEIFSTQFHYIEKELGVDYRSIKKFKGIVVLNNKKRQIVYNFFCRKNIEKNFFNRKKIEKDMLKENILNQCFIENIKVSWFRSADLYNFLDKKIKNNLNYLIT